MKNISYQPPSLLRYLQAQKKTSVLISLFLMVILPGSFDQRVTKTKTPENASVEFPTKFKSTTVPPKIKGLYEWRCRFIQQQSIRAVFKSEIKLRSHLICPEERRSTGFPVSAVWQTYCVQQRMKEHERYPTRSDRGLHLFRAHPQNRTPPALERGKVHLSSRSPFLRAQGERDNPHKTTP